MGERRGTAALILAIDYLAHRARTLADITRHIACQSSRLIGTSGSSQPGVGSRNRSHSWQYQ
jgi:hypothetical protein